MLAVIKADHLSLHLAIIVLSVIFSTANSEEGRQNSMSLTKSHLEILLLLEDYGNEMM